MTTVSFLSRIEEALKQFTALNLLKALIVGIIGLIICKIIYQTIESFIHDKDENPYQDKLLKTIKVILLVLWILFVGDQLGFETSSVLIVFAAVILIFLYAAEDVFANAAGGIVMSYSKLFKKGDFISVGGKEGTVKEILLHCTKLQTLHGETITVPNKNIPTSPVVNYSVLGMRCIQLKIKASYEDDPRKVIEACMEMMENTEGVLHSKPCNAYVSEYGEYNILYDLYFWVNTADCFKVKYEMTAKVFEVFKQKGIRISCPRISVERAEGITAEERNDE